MNVLIVDDEKLIRDVVKEYAISEGYHIFEAEDGEMALDIIETNKINVIVLDIMMPKLDGFSTYKEIKKIENIPTIILSARSEEYDKLLGFELGVDDYLTKPFSPKELIARIKAITKRSNQELDVFEYQDLKGYTIKIDDKEVKVTPKEFEILTYFIKNKNVAISRESLLSSIWSYLVLFSFLILMLSWGFQVLFLSSYYE